MNALDVMEALAVICGPLPYTADHDEEELPCAGVPRHLRTDRRPVRLRLRRRQAAHGHEARANETQDDACQDRSRTLVHRSSSVAAQ